MEVFLVFLALTGVTAATYTDLKENLIPNTFTFSLIGAGILTHLVFGIFRSDPYLALSGLVGAAVGFFLSYSLYRFGTFGGGDVKLMAAVGALLPTAFPPVINSGVAVFTNVPLFPVTVLVNGLLASSPFVVVYALFCFIRGENLSVKQVPAPGLEVGMIPAEAVWETEKKIARGDEVPKNCDSCYADPSDVQGIRDYQIGGLLRLWKEGELERPLKIKRTFPFAPIIAAGTFLAVFFGNLYCTALALL